MILKAAEILGSVKSFNLLCDVADYCVIIKVYVPSKASIFPQRQNRERLL